VVAVATSWLLVVCSLVGWSIAPMALGWQPSLIVSGSMAPRVRPGDVVLVSPLTTNPRVGQVVLVRDPNAATRRVLHRVVRIESDGTFITKGDANPNADTTPHSTDDVAGVARLVVPGAGRLALLRGGHTTTAARLWLWLTLGSLVVFVAARYPRLD
jgi:signal peptidase